MLALNLLPQQLSYRVLRWRKMTLIDTRLIRVIPGDAKGGEQGLEFQEYRLLSGTDYRGEHSSRTMIDRMPQPPLSRFGPHETLHFIQLGGAPWMEAGGAGA
jgi:hypothetical protein